MSVAVHQFPSATPIVRQHLHALQRILLANHPLTLILFGLIGLSVLAWLPVLPDKRLIGCLLIVGLLSLLHSRTFVLAFFLLGIGWSSWQALQVFEAIPEAYVNQPVQITGQVIELPKRSDDLQQFVLKVNQPRWLQGKRIMISWYQIDRASTKVFRQTVQAGEQWQLEGKLRPVYGAINPQGFDYARWLLSRRISGTLSVNQGLKLVEASNTAIDHQRAQLSTWIRETLTDSSSATASALAIGDRSTMTEQQREVLLRTGTGHLLAISGLHVGMVGLLGWLLGRLLCGLTLLLKTRPKQQRPPRPPVNRHSPEIMQHLPLCLSVLTAVSYAVMSGFVVSTGRALVMLLIAGLAVVLRRQLSSFRLLLTALLLTLLINPLTVLGAGLWLSFSAVFWLYWAFHGRVARLRWWQYLIRAQWVLMLGMLPLQLIWFQQLSLVALPANLLAVPFVSLIILPMLLLSMLLHILMLPGADSVLSVTGGLLLLLQQYLEWLASLDYAAVSLTPGNGGWRLLLACAGALWLLAPRGIPIRIAGLLLMLPLLIPTLDRPPPEHWEMQVFDVGQGLAIAIRTQNHVLVYDTGPGDGHGRDRVASAMLPLLRRWGGQIDTLLISHGDLDHAGGYQTALSKLNITNVISSKSSLGQSCHDAQSWQWDGVNFQILHPGEYLPYLGNDSSCVLLIESEHGSALLPGDISKAAEQRLLNLYGGPTATVLVAGHHGSKSSSSSEWLTAVKPQLGLVSAGRWNRFGMPHSEVTDRFAEAGVPLVNTATCGALNLRTDNPKWPYAVADRTQSRHWWTVMDDCSVQP